MNADPLAAVPDSDDADPDPEPGRGKRHRRVTRERLLDAASEVFAERGVLGARVEEVCERAGFTRGAFYSNFSGMEEFIVAVLEREGAAVRARVAEAVTAAVHDPQPMSAVVERLFDVRPFGEANYLLRAELGLLAVRDPELARPYLAVQRQMRDGFARLLEESVAAAQCRLIVPTDDALDTLEAVFDASVRSSARRGPVVESGADGASDDDGSAGDALVRRVLPLLLAALTEPTEPQHAEP